MALKADDVWTFSWSLEDLGRFIGPIGEGSGNPLQFSCLESPRDSRARWAAIYGVAQSRTRLAQLSSSSIGPIIHPPGPYSCLQIRS